MRFAAILRKIRNNLFSPQEPDSTQASAIDILIETRADQDQNEFAAFASKLASIQFGPRANLVRSQFESGLDSADRQNRNNERGCPRVNAIGSQKMGKK